MVGVVAPVSGQVEGNRQAFLPGGEVAAVEGVGLLGGRETRVLPDGPGPLGVHAGVRATQIGRNARAVANLRSVGYILRPVAGLQFDAFGGWRRLNSFR